MLIISILIKSNNTTLFDYKVSTLQEYQKAVKGDIQRVEIPNTKDFMYINESGWSYAPNVYASALAGRIIYGDVLLFAEKDSDSIDYLISLSGITL